MPRLVLLACAIFSAVSGLFAQYRVVEAESGRAVPGATVTFEAGGKSSAPLMLAADAEGRFQLPPQTSGVGQVTAIGFEPLVFLHAGTGDLALKTLRLKAKPYALQAAVVTGQIGQTTAHQAVQPVTVIDRPSIDRIGAVTLRDILLTQSNLQLGQDAQIGTQVKLLGLSGQHIQVLIDGLPVIGRLDGNIDFDQLPLDQVERIEIVEGPMGVEYGSEAIAGTIHLITRRGVAKEAAQAPEGVRAGVRGVAESVGRYQGAGYFEVGDVGGGRLDGRLSRLYFDGFNPPDRSGRLLLWKPKEQVGATLGWTREWRGLRGSVSAEMNQEWLWNDGAVEYVNTTVPVGDSLLEVYRVPYAQDSEFLTRRTVVRADVSGAVGDGWHMDAFWAYNRFGRDRRSFSRNLVDLTALPSVDPELNDTSVFVIWHSRATWTRTWDGSLEGAFGYDVSHEAASGDRLGAGNRDMSNLALFGSLEWQPRPSLQVRPGVRVLHNTVFGTPVIPSLHVKWARGPHAVRASYARGYRAPELKELYFYFVDINHNIEGTEDLQPELSNSFQLGYTLRRLTDRALLSPSIKLFYNQVERMIDLGLVDAETQFYRYVNLGEVTTAGVSLGVERAGDDVSWRIQATGVQRHTRWESPEAQPQRIETLQATAGLDWRLPHQTVLAFQGSYAHNETILQADGAGGWAQSRLSPLTLLGVFLSKRFLDNQLLLSAGVDNLLGATARTISGEQVTTGGIHMPTSGTQPAGMGTNLRFTFQYTLP